MHEHIGYCSTNIQKKPFLLAGAHPIVDEWPRREVLLTQLPVWYNLHHRNKDRHAIYVCVFQTTSRHLA